jgi:hypothetical protein
MSKAKLNPAYRPASKCEILRPTLHAKRFSRGFAQNPYTLKRASAPNF